MGVMVRLTSCPREGCTQERSAPGQLCREHKNEYQRTYMRDWRRRNPAKTRKYRDPVKAREWELRRVYGITGEQYERLLCQQDFRCAVCRRPAAESRNGCLHVDHSHETGAIRGLLCNKCNLGLGLLDDDPAILRAAMTYLSGA